VIGPFDSGNRCGLEGFRLTPRPETEDPPVVLRLRTTCVSAVPIQRREKRIFLPSYRILCWKTIPRRLRRGSRKLHFQDRSAFTSMRPFSFTLTLFVTGLTPNPLPKPLRQIRPRLPRKESVHVPKSAENVAGGSNSSLPHMMGSNSLRLPIGENLESASTRWCSKSSGPKLFRLKRPESWHIRSQ
jgi:hypothetical protein